MSMATPAAHSGDEIDQNVRTDSRHLNTMIHGKDTDNLAQSLEHVSHPTGALKRMISPTLGQRQ